jgi:hypothetical protein
MDFENYKNRPEFSDEHGGEGSVYGGSTIGGGGRPSSPGGSSHWGRDSDRGRPSSRDSERTLEQDHPGVLYPAGYHQTPSALREYSPSPSLDLRGVDSRESPYEVGGDGRALVGAAAPMGATQGAYTPYSPSRDGAQRDYFTGR